MSFTARIAANGDIEQPELRPPERSGHKYYRGHAFIVSGLRHRTGASRLAAQACLRTGAGLVTIIGKDDALDEHAAFVTAIMLREEDDHFSMVGGVGNVIAIGPASGVNEETCVKVLRLLARGNPIVLDADAMTAFETDPGRLFAALHDKAVLTPHEGEFVRLFPDIALTDRKVAALIAAARSGANVLLKGRNTQIASPEGRWAANSHSSPWLATAGSGDVLTGIITGLMAQGSASFDAAAIGAWLHGEIGRRGGVGLTADDMPGLLPTVLADILAV